MPSRSAGRALTYPYAHHFSRVLDKVLRYTPLDHVFFHRTLNQDQWFSISPMRDQDGPVRGISVCGPRRGIAVFTKK